MGGEGGQCLQNIHQELRIHGPRIITMFVSPRGGLPCLLSIAELISVSLMSAALLPILSSS
jgi:hypothetical protein